MAKKARQYQSFDVMVLGAGIVGVSTALHLRRLGLDTALVDRKHPGAEASFGNAGIVRRNGFVPQTLACSPSQLIGLLFGVSRAVTCDPGHFVRMLPWLNRCRKTGHTAAADFYSRTIAPLRALAVEEHLALAGSTNADRFYRRGGWLHLVRTEAAHRKTEVERCYARVFGVAYEDLSADDLAALEPGLKPAKMKAIHWPESCSVTNPGVVVDAFWRGFVHEGGCYLRGDAGKLLRQRGGWLLESERGTVFAPHAVIALGAWSQDVLSGLGESYPLAVKRGYHMHFRPLSGASLSRPVVDPEYGFALTPTDRGIRLTTGTEFAARDAPPNPAVIRHAKKRAEEVFPLGRSLQESPWMGSRPCLPDLLPVIGASPLTPGLWFNFGHAHDGFALGPVCGRLLAETIAGRTPGVDLTGLSPLRFWD